MLYPHTGNGLVLLSSLGIQHHDAFYDDIIKPPHLGGLAGARDIDKNVIIGESKLR